MEEKIKKHLWLFRVQIMQLERNANENKITREEAVKGFEENTEYFTKLIYADFLGIKHGILKLFED